MAPRGRHKKRGNTRMDAALDAMSEFGFSSSLVRQAVKHLLKVYGGDEHWVFIERDSYKVLLDFILDNKKDCGDDGGTKAIMDAQPSTGAAIEDVNISSTELMAISDTTEPLYSYKDGAVRAITGGGVGVIEAVPVNNELIVAISQMDFEAGVKDETGEMENNNDRGVKEETKQSWICDDDDDDDDYNDLVYLKPELIPTALTKILKPSASKG